MILLLVVRILCGAPLAELVDARDSKSRSREGVPVRFWRGAPINFNFLFDKYDC